MPFSSVSEARKKVPSLKNKSDSQVREFNKVFNALLADGMQESEAIPIAIKAANNVNKALASDVERDGKGNILYRAQKFPAFNKPIADSGSKQGKVLAKKRKPNKDCKVWRS